MSTLVEKIVQAIREDIYNGTLEAGEQLKQVELANRYGVSPIPLREALQRLQVEGLVEYFAYRGAIVARMRKGEAADIADIRNALESLAFRIALPDIDEEQIAKLEALTEDLESPRGHDATFFMERLNEYYAVLLAKANRPLLLEMIQTNLKRATRYYAEVVRISGSRPSDAPSRQTYLQAVKARDIDSLTTHMEALHAAYVRFVEAHFED
ncbi:GntR family transcriptional regulator [Chitinimonas koreensis]|uniref:GntR family transcriptional regulator n=1 Tax=Chitinimonas koreensis TaxID=356302 RepID=UPI000417E825|nr:GntR family transcriptional regulator [Chitinimonas koreensis]QNM95369.1 GntR family transcriptional regulator [Chitinimonas koreensis]